MTTHVIVANTVNDALPEAIWWIRTAGLREDSRNGPVLVAPGPVVTEYLSPRQRVLFEPRRDANPVFHLMESLWMLAGQNELAWLAQFNAQMQTYGENGIQWGAYGRRWRVYFGKDQIQGIIRELTKNPNSRRAVIGMWDPSLDLGHEGPDIPCNTHVYFDLRGGRLNMTVCCRSNDLLWGAYGANAVHFSVLQEVIASELKYPMGVYRQMSNNFHIYTEVPVAKSLLETPPGTAHDRYQTDATVMPLLSGSETLADLNKDCKNLVLGGSTMSTEFMNVVAVPLRNNYLNRKAGAEYFVPTGNIDWCIAFREWVARRDTASQGVSA